VENGFLQEVMKGWLISSSPTHGRREHPLHASFWEFCARYCDGALWRTMAPVAGAVPFFARRENGDPRSTGCARPKATNNDIKLLFGTTLYDLKVAGDARAYSSHGEGRIAPVYAGAALTRVPESFFQLYPLEAQVVMRASLTPRTCFGFC